MATNLEDFGTALPALDQRRTVRTARQRRTRFQTNAEPAAADERLWVALKPGVYGTGRVTFPLLPPGMYSIGLDEDLEFAFEARDPKVDDLLRFPDSLAKTILDEIDAFWRLGETFARHGFLHRRGYLLYGPHGSGKSSVVQQIIADILERAGIVFLCGDPDQLARALVVFRRIEPDRPVVCVFEDIDAIVKQHGEDDLLALLDGEKEIDRVLNIATTNYPEHLDRRIVARPRRFDRVIKIGFPDLDARRHYFAHKLHDADASEVERWARETDGLSLAALAEAVISVRCLGHPFDDTIATLRTLGRARASSKEFDVGLGFGDAR